MMRAAVAIAVLAGCYSPQLQPCTVTCGDDSPCPADLTCGADSYCHAAGGDETCHAVLTVDISGDGLVSSSPAGIECTPFQTTCPVEFAGGTQITLTASAFDGQTFMGWTGDACAGSMNVTCALELDISMTITATFE
ncbi:MAG TPA: hypothetical protein VGG28_03465 [Kofleriaceae bacterium]|jgi:hypothetical protein